MNLSTEGGTRSGSFPPAVSFSGGARGESSATKDLLGSTREQRKPRSQKDAGLNSSPSTYRMNNAEILN